MPAFIDFPNGEIDAWSFRIQGWVADPSASTAVRLKANGRPLAPVLFTRPDAEAALPGYAYVKGVAATANVLDILRPTGADFPRSVEITLGVDDAEEATVSPVAEQLARAVPEQLALQQQARAWCLERLRCPACRNPAARLAHVASGIACTGCGSEFPQLGAAIDMLSTELRQAADLTPATLISSNPYEELAEELIRRTTAAGGWVLDCGAGSRPVRRPNVVNVEIENYFSTDVLALGEALPFQDHVFDAALSLAVLEHVRDPFACARELVRVVRPGGEIICSVPFLQPVHGYPDHYYNMTRSGLANLFRGLAEVVDCLTPPNGHPLFAVQWILREYADGLPKPERARFVAMKVDDLIRIDPASQLSDNLAAGLAESARATIACLNTIRLRTYG
jgi:SAM-dependent methyltransferase